MVFLLYLTYLVFVLKKDIGKKIKPMEREDWSDQTRVLMKENGEMEILKGMENCGVMKKVNSSHMKDSGIIL